MFRPLRWLCAAALLASAALAPARDDPKAPPKAPPKAAPRGPRVPDGTKVLRDLAYGPHERNKLDLYVPANADKALPLVVYVHGGGWEAGAKDDPTVNIALPLLGKGYAVAAVNYRLSQHAIFPAQI